MHVGQNHEKCARGKEGTFVENFIYTMKKIDLKKKEKEKQYLYMKLFTC